MARIFAGQGLIFLDPMSPELHRLSLPAMIRAVKDHAMLAAELVARSAALEKAGFHAQVKVTEQSTLVFRIVDRPAPAASRGQWPPGSPAQKWNRRRIRCTRGGAPGRFQSQRDFAPGDSRFASAHRRVYRGRSRNCVSRANVPCLPENSRQSPGDFAARRLHAGAAARWQSAEKIQSGRARNIFANATNCVREWKQRPFRRR